MKRIVCSIFLVSLLFSSCSIQKMAISSMSGILNGGMECMLEENDLRIAEVSLISNLKLIETLIKADPGNEDFLTMASMGYGSYALGFLEDSLPDRASNLYLRGRNYGLRLLKEKEGITGLETMTLDEFSKTMGKIKKDDVPALFWSAYNWGSYINLNVADPEIAADLSKVNEMMQKVIDLDSTFYYGGAFLYFGSMYSKIPKMLGGSPEKSKEYFEKALKINEGKFLMTYVYYAKMYAVAVQDKELFTSLLKKVIETPENILPKNVLPNVMAKAKAQVLLNNIETYF
jgi:hypothetical protein